MNLLQIKLVQVQTVVTANYLDTQLQWRLMNISRGEFSGSCAGSAPKTLIPLCKKKPPPPLNFEVFQIQVSWVERKEIIDLKFFQRGNILTDFHPGGGGHPLSFPF